jgi:hypothetical protein
MSDLSGRLIAAVAEPISGVRCPVAYGAHTVAFRGDGCEDPADRFDDLG